MNRKYFEYLCKMPQRQLKLHLADKLEKYDGDTVYRDGYIYHKGTHPVLLVAHLDTVHKNPPKKFVYKNGALSSPSGIGGDDRCGVYIILDILKKYNCSVLFTEDEEIGAVGASRFATSPYINNLEVNYIVEIDRRGNTDCVFYDCDNQDFVEFIESTGYFKEACGTFSDISVIAPKCGIAAVNLSAGYYHEHTCGEYVVMKDVDKLCKEVCKLLCINTVQYEYVEAEHPWDKWGKWCNTPYYRLDDDTDDLSEDYNEDTYDTKPMYYVADKRYTVEEYYYAVNRYEAGGRFLSEYTQFHWDDLFIEYLGDDNYSM